MTDPIRLGIIGCGRVVEFYHASAILGAPAWRVTDVADADPVRLDWAGATFAAARRHAGIAGLLADGSAEAVLIATPAGAHAADVEAALDHGRAVLVEKPLATTVADAERLAAQQAHTDRTVAVGFNRRFRAGYRELRERLRAAGAAMPTEVVCTLMTDAGRWGRRAKDGGDPLEALLDDVPPHQVDLLPWLFGRPVARVRVTHKAEDAGPVLDYELDLAGGPKVRCRAGHGARYVEELVLDGALAVTGGDRAPLGRPAVLARSLGAGLAPARSAWARVTGRPSPARASFAAQLDAFAAALRGAAPTDLADIDAGLRACRAVDACRRSLAAGGAWIDIAQGGVEHG